MKKKNWTGERLETHVVNLIAGEHLHRYALARELINDKIVLDIASGEGYGSNIMSKTAKHVIGVDIDSDAICKAQKKYVQENLEFKVGTADNIPVANQSVDVVISFETLEHHDKHQQMMLEIKRILKPHGCLIMSSPDKRYYSEDRNYQNPFHVKELYQSEFKELIKTYFTNCIFYNQRSITGSLILSEHTTKEIKVFTGNYTAIHSDGHLTPVYNLVIASDGPINDLTSSFFDGSTYMDFIKTEITNTYKNSNTWKAGEIVAKPIILLKKLFLKWTY